MPTLSTAGSATINRSSTSGASASRYDLAFAWSLPANAKITKYYWTFDIIHTSGYYSKWYCYYNNGLWGQSSTAQTVKFDVTSSYSGTSGTARIYLGLTGSGKVTFSNIKFCADYEYTATASTWSLTTASVAADGASTIGIGITSATAGATHRVTYAFGSLSSTYSLASGTTSHSIAVPLSWCAQMPSAVSGTGSVTVETIVGGSVIGSETKYFTVTVPASVVPTAGSLTVTGGNLFGGLYLQNRSTATVTASGYGGSQGSTITGISISGGGYSSSAATLTTGAFAVSGTVTFTLKVTDSRGRTATATKSISVTAYSPPAITGATAQRANAAGAVSSSGTYIRAVCGYTYSPVGSNAVTLTIQYRVTGASAWTSAYSGSPASGAAQVFGGGGISIQSSYEVRFTLADSLGSTAITATVGTGYVYMRWDPLGNKFGFGCYPEGSNRIQIADNLALWTQGRDLSLNTHHLVTEKRNLFTAWDNTGLTTNFYYPNYTMTNQPSTYGNLLSIGNGGEKSQLWFTQATGTVYHRQGNGSGWSGQTSQATEDTGDGWTAFLDSSNWLNIVYPVGALYISYVSTSPASLFGGTWTQLTDRFLVGAGNSYSAGATGGENTHILTASEIPSTYVQTAKGTYIQTKDGTLQTSVTANWSRGAGSWSSGGEGYITTTGGGGAHNNMPPYLAVYMWRRTA